MGGKRADADGDGAEDGGGEGNEGPRDDGGKGDGSGAKDGHAEGAEVRRGGAGEGGWGR